MSSNHSNTHTNINTSANTNANLKESSEGGSEPLGNIAQGPSAVPKNTGVKRLIKASFYTYKGLRHAVQYEAAFRQECIAALILIPAALIIDFSAVERLMLVGAVLLVMIVELLNTGIEAVVDRVGVEYHELAGLAKDMGSAAVMLALIYCIAVWVTFLTQHFLAV